MQTKQNLRMVLAASMIFLPILLSGQALQWSFNYGGSQNDYLTRIISSNSGGFLAGGNSYSADIDLPSNAGSSDAWVIKVNAPGEKEFVSVFGGSSDDIFKDAVEVDNAYFMMLFNSYSANGDFPANSGDLDIWLKSITFDGQAGGSLHFGGSGKDDAVKLAQAPAGSHLIVGQTNSNDGTFGSGLGGKDAFCIRLSSTSQITWVKKFGTKDEDGFVDALALPDGNLLFYGSKFQSNLNTGWLLKTNSLGEFLDEANFEKVTGVFPVCMMHHAGHIYVAANTNNVVSKVTNRHMMIYKFDENLDYVSMNETGGGDGNDIILDMKPYDDQHILCLVASNTNQWPFHGNHGEYDLFYVLFSNDFDLIHSRPFGGSSYDGSHENGGNFIMDGAMAICASRSYSGDGDVPGNYGSYDGWIFKADPVYSLGLPDEGFAAVAGMQVSPNPAEDEILVSEIPDDAAFITITDLAGRQVFRTDVDKSSVNIPLSGLPSGMYLVRAGAKDRVLPPVKFVRR
ncbi:T9SS type A sorting domain-containing protein [Lentimicrobium sp.]|uniref:T9SS type A sorting domain-containing protein n=1 Tax=Lentimicrobium sp. TaxID=2034841 RepID=UPI002C06AB67|nr:T9SS type A sorting domain-containing protein [Lentimicrobium sp.]HPJ63087.1 T9SS type A sorting domain-containing protein [Lentimicrobium sp.]HRW69953.1 T9SS type A sorting domain-containing protein [Lentimicrobium sp.]